MNRTESSRTTVTVRGVRVDMRDEAGRLTTFFIDLGEDGIFITPITDGEKAPSALLSYPRAYALGEKRG